LRFPLPKAMVSVGTSVSVIARVSSMSSVASCIVGCAGTCLLCFCPFPDIFLCPCFCLCLMGHLSLPYSCFSLRFVVSSLVCLLEFVPMSQCVVVVEGSVVSFCGGILHTDVQFRYIHSCPSYVMSTLCPTISMCDGMCCFS
jgi:hypothetical protein